MKKSVCMVLALVLFVSMFSHSVLAAASWENYFAISGITIGQATPESNQITFNPANSSQRVGTSVTYDMITGFSIRLTKINIASGGAIQFGLTNSRGGWWGYAGLVFMISTAATETTLGDTPYGYLICQDMSNFSSGTKVITQPLSNPVGDILDISLKKTSASAYTFLFNGQQYDPERHDVVLFFNRGCVSDFRRFGVRY